ncbi:DUF6804 family protein [Cloacibacterium sp.]|uniref:DUF6804 family protein n=1 Tax=Cloacibacterium sp. TaxID=1913682 RepID=UPI0039E6C8C7
MKLLFIFCALSCFLGILKLPIEYYTFLRIVVSLGAILAIYNFIKIRNYFWLGIFAGILLLFNPIFPIYLYQKSIWLPIDVVVGILFLLLTFFQKKDEKNETVSDVSTPPKIKPLEKIITPKNKN